MSIAGSVTSYLHIGPIRMRVRTFGEGPPLLMIMGLGANLNMWEPFVPYLPGRHLIMFDFPGTGGSGLSWLPPTMAYDALLVRRLLRKLDYGRVDVLGYSWGGVLAQQLAIQHPRAVRRLILASTNAGVGSQPPPRQVVARMLTARRYYSRSYFKAAAPIIYGGRYRRDPRLVDAEFRRRVGRPPSPWGYAAQLTAILSYSSLPALPLISAPTLVLAGSDDPLVGKFNPKLLAGLIRHSTLEIVPDAGHLMLLDSPEIVAPIIEKFLSDNDV